MADTSLTSGLLRINDIELRVPPKNIAILKQDHNAVASTLRSQTSTWVKSGRRTISIIVDTYFADGYDARNGVEVSSETWVNQELAPLLIQARKCPFVSIENEKIRKEILSDPDRRRIEGLEDANMAAIIKQIDIEAKAKEPGTFHVRIHMEWFNYLPFSPNFAFKRVDDDGNPSATDVPDNQFSSFIRSGTLIDGDGGPSRFINSITPGQNNLEIIYKEYRRIDTEKLEFKKDFDAFINFDLDKSEDYVSFPKGRDSNFDKVLNELQKQGWEFEDEFQASRQEPGRIISRYRRFVIRDVDPAAVLESGRLLVESARISLTTKTAQIPLIGHTVPTAQFLGAADGSIALNLFANAELENRANDGAPVGTSSQLSKLNSIIELVSINAVKYRRVAKNDVIFIKHPMANLLRYKPYDENTLRVVDDSTGNITSFSPNEYLACIVQNTESHTIEGLPYCSRFNLVLTENYRSRLSNTREVNQGPSNRVYESSKTLVQKLADKYGIERIGRSFELPSDNLINDPDFAIASKLLSSLNDALLYKDFASVSDALADPDLAEARMKDIKAKIRDSGDQNSGAGGLSPRDISLIQQNRKEVRPFSSDIINEIVWDLLKVTSKAEEGDRRFSDYQESLVEFRGFNLTVDESNYPDMMLPDQTMQPDFFFFNNSDQANNKIKKKVLENVRKRYFDSAEQMAEQLLNKDASRNISEDMMGSPGPVPGAPNLISVGEKSERIEKSDFDKAFAQLPLDGEQQEANIQTAVDSFADNTYSMRRSMPTFKLYIKEDDIGSLSDVDKSRLGRLASTGIWRNFTDFYDLNAIVDIRLVKDKYNPADILVVRLTNTREDIINKAYEDNSSKLEDQARQKSQRTKPRGATDGRENKADLNELDGVMLKEGTKIELRLGYEGDPNHLSVEFSGRVSQIGGGDIVEIVCQGDGVELIQELKGVGVADEFTWNSNTQNLISELLHNSPEVQSFGTINAKTMLGDVGLFWRGAGGRTAVENIFAPSLFGSWDNFGDTVTKWTSRGVGAGGLIAGLSTVGAGTLAGAGIGAAIGGAIGVASGVKDTVFSFFKGSKFTVYEQTVWDVLQELALRHPGIICDVVNFDRRSTIFFGYPDQLYFFRGPTFEEAIAMDGDSDFSSTLGLVEKNTQDALLAKTGRHSLSKVFSVEELKKNISKLINGKAAPKDTVLNSGRVIRSSPDDGSLSQTKALKDGEMLLSLMKQYRNYHMITSEHDIIENGMIVNSDDVYNSIQVVFPEDSDNSNFNGSVGFAKYEKTDEIKADDDLNKDFIKRQTLVFHNAHKDLSGLDLPEKYAVSSLCRSLNNVYKGRIKILGRPGIKPHDIVFIYDSYNNVYGPVEVASIIHTFSYSTGWVTEIVPHMIVAPTTSTSVLHINAIQRLVSSFYLKNIKLFYSGAIFNNQGNLENDLEGDSGLLKELGITAGTNAVTGLTGATTGILAQRAVKDGLGKVRAARRLSATKDVSKLGLLTKGAKFGLGRFFGASLPIVGDLMVDYAVGGFTNWSKYRQPIIFLPVTRNGKPWYTALYGLNNNTEMDAIKDIGKDILKKGEFFLDYMKEEFTELFN
jgi:hypothetical protein